MLPTSSSSSSVKRPREDGDTPDYATPSTSNAAAVTDEPSPPKRPKTEWEGPPDDVLKAKTEAVENIQTEEDASAFLEKMTELIKTGHSSDISDTLDMILKGYGGATDGLGMGDMGGARESSPPPLPLADAFDEFFDFSLGGLDEDDVGSKAPTPDLLSSSSTNPSPESASEADAAHGSTSSTSDIKREDFQDLLRLGTLKEIDGGESAYYQPSDWKWDGPMTSSEQPWAIFSS